MDLLLLWVYNEQTFVFVFQMENVDSNHKIGCWRGICMCR